MKRVLPFAVAAGALLASVPAQADLSLGGRLGTTGYGLEVGQKFSPQFGLRAGVSGWRYSVDFDYDDVEYDVESDLSIGSLLLDWYPGSGIFRITGGAAYYHSLADLQARPNPALSYQIGDATYTGAQIGVLNGEIEYSKPAAYLGVGWDFMARKKSGFGVAVDLGLYYHGKPDDISLTASGGTLTVTSADLATEIRYIEDDAPSVHYQLGATFYYRF